MSNWLDKIMPSKIRSESRQRTGVPEGLWKKCPKCGAFLYKPELEKNLDVCPKCNHHMRVNARRRLISSWTKTAVRKSLRISSLPIA